MMPGPEPDNWSELDGVKKLRDMGGELSFEDVYEAIQDQIRIELEVCVEAAKRAGGYGEGHYRIQAQTFDAYVTDKCTSTRIDRDTLSYLLEPYQMDAHLKEMRSLSASLQSLAAAVPRFEDSSIGYGISDTRDVCFPVTKDILERAERFIARKVETLEIRTGQKTDGWRFYLPADLLKDYLRVASAIGALDGTSFESIPDEKFAGVIVQALAAQSGLEQRAVLLASKQLCRVQNEAIQSFKDDYAAPLASIIERVLDLERKMADAIGGRSIELGNPAYAAVESLELSLKFFSLSKRVRTINPVIAWQSSQMAKQFMEDLRSFGDRAKCIEQQHKELWAR